MSSSPKKPHLRPQDQTTPQTRHTTESRFPPTYTPPPPSQFMPTPGTEGSNQPECTLMTHDQYVVLKNEYRAMMKELRRYNEHRASQQGSIVPRQYLLRPIQNQSNLILKNLKHLLNLGNHNTPPRRGQVGLVSPHQQEVEGKKLRPTRPITLRKQNRKMLYENYNN